MAHGWKYCLLQTCKDFGNNTSLHGWKYIVDTKRDRFEKYVQSNENSIVWYSSIVYRYTYLFIYF